MGEAAENLEMPAATPDASDELARIVKESERKIAEEKPEAKRGRGRPAGTFKSTETYYHKKKYGSDAGASAVGTGPTHESSSMAASASDQFEDISEALAVPFLTLSQIPARRHGIPELALSTEEAAACGASVQKILNAYAPEMSKMDPKSAAVVGACITVGSIAIAKVMIYASAKNQIIEMQRTEQANAPDGRTDTPQFEPTPQQREEQVKAAADRDSKPSFFPRTASP